MNPRVLPAGLLFGLAAAPRVAQAHLASTELGPFYDGAAHLWVSPSDALTVVALALIAGLGGAAPARRALIAAAAGWVVGLAVASRFTADGPPSLLPTGVTLMLLGGAAAAQLPLSERWAAGLGGVLGLARGAFNGLDLAATGSGWLPAVGVATSVFVSLAILSAVSVRLARGRFRVGLRVAGSWVAAIGLLMAGWTLAGGA